MSPKAPYDDIYVHTKKKYYRCECKKCKQTFLGYQDVSYHTRRNHRLRDEEEAATLLTATPDIDMAQATVEFPPAESVDSGPEGGMPDSTVDLPEPFPHQDSFGSRGSPLPASPLNIPELANNNQLDPQDFDDWSIRSAGSDETSLFGSPIAVASPRPALDELPPVGDIQLVYLPHEDPTLFDPPAAVLERPHIRLAYLAAVAANLIDHVKRKSVERTLNMTLLGYSTINALPDYPKPVTTLNKVYQRLGLDARAFIHKRPMCSQCYRVYTFDAIKSAPSPKCNEAGCTGTFWEYTNLSKSERRPKRVAAYSDIVGSLRRMFMRPDFVAALRAGAQAHENHGDGSVLYDVCDGTAWGPHQFGLLRHVRRDGIVEDLPAPNPIPIGFGLFASLNLDWFRVSDKYSVGGIYISILNLHRAMRNQPWNIILACTVPGPGEPSLEELNHVLEPIVTSLQCLYKGIPMRVYEEMAPREVQARVENIALKLLMANNDSPARQKLTGTAGQRSEEHFCICYMRRSDINTKKGYEIENFRMRNDLDAIQLAYDIRGADAKERQEYASQHGIRWSAMNMLPGWLTYSSAPLDLMHNLYLGIVRHMWMQVVIAGYFLTAENRRQFESFLDGVQWPSRITRPPKNLTTVSTKKADEWRRLLVILPVALWFVWKDAAYKIPIGAPRIPPDAKTKPTFNRCRQMLYNAIILLCAASNFLGSWPVTMSNVSRGQQLLKSYCLALLGMRITMMPNHHWAMHYETIFRRFGPAYAWWVYAFERFNGLLQKVNVNYQEGKMEFTLMQFWIRMHRLYELAHFLPENASQAERDVLQSICSEFGAKATASVNLGLGSDISTPRLPSEYTNLRQLDHPEVYGLLLAFSRTLWPNLDLRHDLDGSSTGRIFFSDQTARSLAYITKSGARFGCATAKRNQRDQYAFVSLDNSLVPCQLVYHFQLEIPGENPVLCSVIRRFMGDDELPRFPWDLYAVELGIYVSYANKFGFLEVVDASKVQAPLALCTVHLQRPRNLKIWISVSYEKSGLEDAEEHLGDELDEGNNG